MDYINRPVSWNGATGTVTAETTKRGRTLLTIALADGRMVKVDAAGVDFPDISAFAPPTGRIERPQRDYYGDARRMSARW